MRTVLAAFFLALAAATGQAQTAAPVIAAGIAARLYSDVLDEERGLLIALPRSFDSTTQRYPALFLLDGEDHFRHAAATTEFLAGTGRIPEIVVVGVTNSARLRDLSPPTDMPEEAALGTGGDTFLDFIVQELIPWLEQTYRVAPLRILFGHSRGGLINLHALLTRPDAFDAHIAASPYFGWSNERMIVRAENELARVAGNRYLYMTAGDSEPDIKASVEKLAKVFARNAPREFEWQYQPLAGEDHGSTPLPTLYQGLRDYFSAWLPTKQVDAADVTGVEAHYATLSREHRYEVVPSAIVYWELGNTLIESGRAGAHVDMFERSTRAYPANRYLFDNLGVAYWQAGLEDEARKALRRARELGRTSETAEERAESRRQSE